MTIVTFESTEQNLSTDKTHKEGALELDWRADMSMMDLKQNTNRHEFFETNKICTAPSWVVNLQQVHAENDLLG